MTASTEHKSDNAGESSRVPRHRHPAQNHLMFAAAGVIVGSFMPWVNIAGQSLTGFSGAGIWTFYIGALGLAGSLVPFRTLAIVQGAIMGLAAIGLSSWQFLHLVGQVGFSGWLPGPGLVVVFTSGALALLAGFRMRTST